MEPRSDAPTPPESFSALCARIRACRICEGEIPAPRPVFRASQSARILIAGQAPGVRVHASGKPFTDPSGDRLRDWMGVTDDEFYDERRIAIVPMGFCFPGLDKKGSDKPPRRECAPAWRADLLGHLHQLRLTLMIGGYALKWHAPDIWTGQVSSTVENWRAGAAQLLPLPHPSWRNNAWIKKRPWFSDELLPELKRRVRAALDG